MDNSTVSKITKDYLKGREKDNSLVSVSTDVPKSFIVTDNNVYISQLSSQALSGRIKY